MVSVLDLTNLLSLSLSFALFSLSSSVHLTPPPSFHAVILQNLQQTNPFRVYFGNPPLLNMD